MKHLSKLLALALCLALLGTLAVPAMAEEDITSWILEENPESISGTVRWWMPFKGSAGMDALIADFNKTYPNIKVELTTYNNNSDGNMAVNTAIMAGEVDVLASFGLSNAYRRWENGLYIDITDRIKEEGIDLVANWGTDVFKYDDRYYTFPSGGLSYYICINMDAWNEAGLGEIPTEWTWDEYIAASKAMTKVNPDGSIAMYGGSDYHSQNYWTYAYGQVYGKNAYYNEDGSKSSFDNEIIRNALKREYQAEIVDKIWFPKATYRGDNLQTQMLYCGKNQDVHVASAINCNMPRFLADQENYPTDYVTAFAPYPVNEKGQVNYMSGVAPFSHSGLALNCKDVEASWAFLKWYSTYGVKYLVAAGHQPNWRGTDPADAVKLLFGSEEAAAKIIDIESFKRVVGVSTNPYYYEDILTAYSDVNSLVVEYTMYVLNGTMDIDEALSTLTEMANEKIADAD